MAGVVLTTARFDGEGHFIGHEGRRCGEHHTVGGHRAWCLDCREWCYPQDPCERCPRPLRTADNEPAGGYVITLRGVRDQYGSLPRAGTAYVCVRLVDTDSQLLSDYEVAEVHLEGDLRNAGQALVDALRALADEYEANF